MTDAETQKLVDDLDRLLEREMPRMLKPKHRPVLDSIGVLLRQRKALEEVLLRDGVVDENGEPRRAPEMLLRTVLELRQQCEAIGIATRTRKRTGMSDSTEDEDPGVAEESGSGPTVEALVAELEEQEASLP